MSVVLTKSRCINALKCYGSYALNRLGSALFLHRTPYTIHHSPLFVSIEPASVCQLKCPACPVGQRSNRRSRSYSETILQRSDQAKPIVSDLMPLEVFRRVLAECRETAWVMQFYFQGEPLLNKDLPTMIREAHEAGLYTIVSTNAQAMTERLAEELVRAGLDRITISMDGLTEASYSAYRIGGSLDKTKAAIRYLREAKQKFQISNFKFQIELQCLRLRSNEQEWPEFKRQYKALGADRLVFKTAQLYEYENGHPLMPSDARYSRYIKGTDGKYHRRPLGKGCLRVWSGVVVTTNGDVLPCCYDKDRTFAYGNIVQTPLAELLRNDKARAFRQAALNEQPQICKECWR